MKKLHATVAGPALLALLAIAGCAPMTWQKNGGTQDEFSRAQYTCMQQSQQRVSGAAVNAFGGYATNQVVTNDGLYRACMMRISANVTDDFGNVTGLPIGAELRGMDCRDG